MECPRLSVKAVDLARQRRGDRWTLPWCSAKETDNVHPSSESSCLPTNYCCLAHQTMPYTPPTTSLKFVAVVTYEEPNLPASEVHTSRWGPSSSGLCTPNFGHCSAPRRCVWASGDNLRNTNLKRLTALADKTILITKLDTLSHEAAELRKSAC